MKMMLKLFVVISVIVLLASCASKGGVSTSGTSDIQEGAATTETAPGGAEAYGYARDTGLRGEAVGGPTATLVQRVVYFDFDSAEIRSDSRPVVEAHARYLVENPAAAVILEGHTDERGTREYNIGLGERRADAVRQLMIAYGVAVTQIQVVSYGEERPAVSGQDESSYAQNRRVEITY